MPFGLRNAAQSYQRFIDFLLRDLDFCYAYIDILIALKDPEEHERHVKILLKRLQEFGLVINSGKCSFSASEINFLGYVVDSQGVRPDPDRGEAILKYPRPATVKNLRQFLRSVNFYRRFIPGTAKIQHPLNTQLCGPKKKNNTPI